LRQSSSWIPRAQITLNFSKKVGLCSIFHLQ
jgi:hypothetical protein